MERQDSREALLELLEKEASRHGLDLVELELQGSRKAPLLRLYLDYEDPALGSISLDELARANHWVSKILDDEDPFDGPYTLEISSPGLERPLRREKDFARFLNRRAHVRMEGYEGRRNYKGTIERVEDGVLTLNVDGERFELPIRAIAHARLELNLDEL